MYYDPEMITTMLNNLLGNAIKYTRKGDITLSLKPKEIDGINYVDLSVKDTGEGIGPEELPHIFKRYYQAKHNKKIAGTGIGLALTKNLVDLHEATIRVESEKGKGSIFTIRFVRDNSYPSALHKEVTETIEAETGTKNTEISATPEHLTLLIVEDDEDVRDYIANAFASTYNVVCAENGKEGLEKVRETLPDIVVSDIIQESGSIQLSPLDKEFIARLHKLVEDNHYCPLKNGRG